MTYHGHTVGVVIPAYNEEPFIADVVEGLPDYVDRVYVVDDCSTDGTWEELTDVAAEENARRTPTDPFEAVVVPIQHERNRGAGGTTLTGYRRALEDDLDLVARMDGDGQMDPSMLSHLLDPLVEGRVSYTKGDRLARVDYVSQMSRWRLFGNVLLTGLTRVASGYWRLRDPQNGYTAITNEALASLDFDDLLDDYGFLNDLLIHLNAEGYEIADVAHPAQYGDEESDIEYSSFVPRLSRLLAVRWLWRLRSQSDRGVGGVALGSLVAGILAITFSISQLVMVATGDSGSDESLKTDGGAPRTVSSKLTATVLVAALSFSVGILADALRRGPAVVRTGAADEPSSSAEAPEST